MNIRKPRIDDWKGLVKLSGKFAKEHDWAKDIPIGQINTKEKAEEWLFGENIYRVLVVEEICLIGYVSIKNHESSYEASILVDPEYRGKGMGKRLIDDLFASIPKDIEVEAWVADFNKKSLIITPNMGFMFKEKFLEKDFIPGREFYVHIFTRWGDKKLHEAQEKIE